MSALSRTDATSLACLRALENGADFDVFEEATSTEDLLAVYRRRARHVAVIGLDHGGFEETLADIESCSAPRLRLGQVTDRTERRHYQLFLSAVSDDVIGCLWVHHDPSDDHETSS